MTRARPAQPSQATTNSYAVVKRAIDVAVSALGLGVLLPVLAAAALLIRVDTRGPALFRQQRLGRGGRVFTMLKFRSMTIGAEAQGVYEQAGDPRVTRVGTVLRRTSIDELPQLLNVLKGDMSLVGPRPTLTYHPWPIDEYSAEQFERFGVRPGITGWAQVRGRKGLPWPQRIELDREYVRSLTLGLDVKILVMTFGKVASGSGNVNTGQTIDDSDSGTQ